MGPVKQYVSERADKPLALHVYPGADGIYEDDGANFAYERGEFMGLETTWTEPARQRRFSLALVVRL